jgi:hypothetical protein
MRQRENLSNAQLLRRLLEKEPDQDLHGCRLPLLIFLDTLIRDIEFDLGQIENPYRDNLQRRTILRQMLHGADRIFDTLAEKFDGQSLPPAEVGLCQFLFVTTLTMALTIQAIEAEYPEQAQSFASERAEYAATPKEAR